MNMRLWLRRVGLAAVLAGGVAACDETTNTPPEPPIHSVPEAWRGTWSVRLLATLCHTSIALFDTTVTSDICPGDSIRLPFDFASMLCNGGTMSATASSLSFSCAEDSVSLYGCSGNIDIHLSIQLDAGHGTLGGSGRANFVSVPAGSCQDVCLDLGVNGTRIGTEPNCPGQRVMLSGESSATRRTIERLLRQK